MKEGTVAESGTHEELIKLQGEYANLYNIQASARKLNSGVRENLKLQQP